MPAEPGIFWINKTSKSLKLSQSKGSEKSLIFSHVQRGPRILTPPKSLGSSSSTSSPSDCKAFTKTKAKSQKNIVASKRAQNEEFGVLCPYPDFRHTDDAYSSPRASGSERPSAALLALDRIWASKDGATSYMGILIEFYRSPKMRRLFPSKSMADASQYDISSLASQDPVFLASLLCAVSAAMHGESGQLRHANDSLYFKSQAICLLKMMIANPNSEDLTYSVVYAIALLLWVECLQGNTQEIHAHVSGLGHLVERIGGIDNCPYPIAAASIAFSYMCAAMTQTAPPIRPPRSFDATGPQEYLILPDTDSYTPFTSMATSFFRSSNFEVLGAELLQIISQQRECIICKELNSIGVTESSQTQFESVSITQMEVDYRLLCLPFADRNGPSPLTPIQNAARLALFVFAQPIVSIVKSSSAFHRSMSQQIQASLQRTSMPSLKHTNSDLLTWVLFILAHISLGQVEYSWAVKGLAGLAEYMQLDDLEQFRDVLAAFYYLDSSFKETLKNVWHDIQYCTATART